jgi:hypothetical protein
MSLIEKLKTVTLEHRKTKTGLGPSLQFHTSEIVNVGKIPRDPVPAGMWPQICWMHRHKDDDMNKWDIVAYKVLK